MQTIKRHRGIVQKMRARINALKLAFMLLTMIFYTAFTLVMLRRSWANSVYLYIIMGFIIVYVACFAAVIIIMHSAGKKIDNHLRNYKSGLTILKSILALLSIGLAISVFSVSLIGNIKADPFKITVLIFSFIWAIFQIVYQITKIIKRRKKSQIKRLSRKRKYISKH